MGSSDTRRSAQSVRGQRVTRRTRRTRWCGLLKSNDSKPKVESLRREDGTVYARRCTGCGACWKMYQCSCHAADCSVKCNEVPKNEAPGSFRAPVHKGT